MFANQNSRRSSFLAPTAPGSSYSPHLVIPLFAALQQGTGIHSISSLSGTPHPFPLLTHFVSYSYKLFCAYAERNSLIFKQLQTLSPKHPGWGHLIDSFLGINNESASPNFIRGDGPPLPTFNPRSRHGRDFRPSTRSFRLLQSFHGIIRGLCFP